MKTKTKPSHKSAVPNGKRAAASKAARSRRTWSALDFSYNDHEMFVAVMPVSEIFPVSVVSRMAEDPERGYQRHLAEARGRRIAEYFQQGNVIPGSIILSAQPEADLRYDSAARTLTFSEQQGAFLVIDGQHRLYGAHKANSDVLLCACILKGLEHAQEVQYFLDVNGTQRGVPKTLQLELLKFLAAEDSPDELRVRLFKALNTDPESPLSGRLSPDKTVPGKLSHVPFKTAIDPRLQEVPLKAMKFENKVRLIINFLRAAQHILIDATNSDSKLTNAAFFQALFLAFPEVVTRARLTEKDLKEPALYNVMLPLRDIRWELHSGTNKKAIGQLGAHMKELLDDGSTSVDQLV